MQQQRIKTQGPCSHGVSFLYVREWSLIRIEQGTLKFHPIQNVMNIFGPCQMVLERSNINDLLEQTKCLHGYFEQDQIWPNIKDLLAWTKCLMYIWTGPNALLGRENNDNAEKYRELFQDQVSRVSETLGSKTHSEELAISRRTNNPSLKIRRKT